MSNINVYIGNQISVARKNIGITQEELAKVILLERASLSNIEAGRQPISIDKLYLLAAYLEENITFFLPSMEWVEHRKNMKIKRVIEVKIM